jgi:antitoxin MazE
VQISRWGNSLAVRLPARVAKAAGLREGGEVEWSVEGDGRVALVAVPERDEAEFERRVAEFRAKMRALGIKLPPDYKFDREEANSRD